MIKIGKNILFSLAASILLAGCSQIGDTSSNSETLSSSQISSGEETSSSELAPIDMGTQYESYFWDGELIRHLAFIIGDEANSFPTFKATKYYLFYEFDDDGDAYAEVRCVGVNEKSAYTYFEAGLKAEGFDLSTYSENYYAYRMVDYTKDLLVPYWLEEDDEGQMLVFRAYIKKTRLEEFPQGDVIYYLGYELPAAPGKAYSGQYNSTYGCLDIYALFVGDNDFSTYLSSFKDFNVTAQADDYCQLTSFDGYSTITLYSTYGEYNCKAILMRLTNSFPTMDLYAYLGEQIPKIEGGSQYVSFRYMDLTATDDFPFNVALCIYYDGFESSIHEQYVKELQGYGWKLDEDIYETSSGILMGNMSKTIEKQNRYIDVMYQKSSSALCIAVYFYHK